MLRRQGGKVQSGGHRTSSRFRQTVEAQYDQFHPFILKPFDPDFDVEKWLAGTKTFKHFGIGLATIYLNRVDKKRFPILNNKTADSLALFDISLPLDTVKRYKAVIETQQQLMRWFPQFDNFYRADALNQFLIGEEEGKPWKKTMGDKPSNPPGETNGTGDGGAIWKISHGKVDFTAEQQETYLQQHTAHVHKDTKKGQGTLFASQIKEGGFLLSLSRQ